MDTSEVHTHMRVCLCVHVSVSVCALGVTKKWQKGTTERMCGWRKITGLEGLLDEHASKTTPRPTPVQMQSQACSLRQGMSRKTEDPRRAPADSKWVPGAERRRLCTTGSSASCAVDRIWQKRNGWPELCLKNSGHYMESRTIREEGWNRESKQLLPQRREGDRKTRSGVGKWRSLRASGYILGWSGYWACEKQVWGESRILSSFRHRHQRLVQLRASTTGRFLGILGGKPRVCFQGRPGVHTVSKDHYSMCLNKSTQTAFQGCPALIIEVVRAHYEELEKLKKNRVKVVHISSTQKWSQIFHHIVLSLCGLL